jgi:integrase
MKPVRFNARQIHVRVSLQRVNGEVLLVEPKSAKGRRTVVMPDVVVQALKAHRVDQLEQRLLAGHRWTEGGVVFTTRTGRPLEPSNMTKMFKAVLKQAGLPDVRFHDLRHTAASFLLAMGVDPRTIMQTLGHSQISLTLNTYAHVLPVLQQEAANRIDHLLGAGA